MHRSHETRVVNVKLILIIQIRWANKIKEDVRRRRGVQKEKNFTRVYIASTLLIG